MTKLSDELDRILDRYQSAVAEEGKYLLRNPTVLRRIKTEAKAQILSAIKEHVIGQNEAELSIEQVGRGAASNWYYGEVAGRNSLREEQRGRLE